MKSHVRLISSFLANNGKARNVTNLQHVACYSSRTDTKTLLERALSPFVPSSEVSLAQKLIEESIFYARGDVLVVNKPYGISMQGYKDLKGILFKKLSPARKFGDSVDDDRAKKDPGITLESCIPLLQQHYLGEDLTLVGGLKRYVSGPVIIPCKKNYITKMRRSKLFIAANRKNDFRHHRALVICTGKLMKEGETGTVLGYCSHQQNSEGITEYIFTPGGSKKDSKKEERLITRDAADYEVLASNKGMSLIDLQFSKFNMHFPRLVLSYLGCPAFGDRIYMRRLIQEGNEVTCVDPKDLWRAADKQYLPSHFMKLIGADKADYLKLQDKIPLYMAVVQSIYPEFGNTKETMHSEFVARADVPDHFYAMAELLGFHTHIETFMKSLEVEETADFSHENLQRVKMGSDAKFNIVNFT